MPKREYAVSVDPAAILEASTLPDVEWIDTLLFEMTREWEAKHQ